MRGLTLKEIGLTLGLSCRVGEYLSYILIAILRLRGSLSKKKTSGLIDKDGSGCPSPLL